MPFPQEISCLQSLTYGQEPVKGLWIKQPPLDLFVRELRPGGEVQDHSRVSR